MFATKKKKEKLNISSPFKNKIINDEKKTFSFTRFCISDPIDNLRKRNFTKMKDQNQELRKDSDEYSDNEENCSNFMGLFKRAKRHEEDINSRDVFVPKLKTIKKRQAIRFD